MAGIRMSGLISNMDTESIVKSMMDAHRLKLTKIENKKTLLEWKQDKWKDLNTKLYKLYQEQTSKLHLTPNYKTKKVTSANESVVKVTADKTATAGTHSIAVKTLASSQYITGGKLGDKDGKDTNGNTITSSTKLTDLKIMAGASLTIESGEPLKSQATLLITSSTKISDLVKSCKDAGLNASFDEKQQRLFISSSKSGKDQAFTITSKNMSGVGSKEQGVAIGSMKKLLANKNAISGLYDAAKKDFYEKALDKDRYPEMTDDQIAFAKEYKKLYDLTELNVKTNNIEAAKEEAQKVVKGAIIEAINSNPPRDNATIGDNIDITGIESFADLKLSSDEENEANDVIEEYGKKELKDAEKIKKLEAYEKNVKEEMLKANPDIDFKVEDVKKDLLEKIKKKYKEELTKEKIDKKIDSAISKPTGNIEKALTDYSNSFIKKAVATANTDLINTIQGVLDSNGLGLDGNVLDCLGLDLNSTAKRTLASDCTIIYNGAELTSSSNSLTVNGLTLEAVSISESVSESVKVPGTNEVTNVVTYKPTSITVTNDSQGMYDMVKKFLTEYNSILKDMNALYYADSARGYNPLTDEEKEAMTDDQIKLWEDKIKDSSLRRDSTLGGITSAMKQAMSQPVIIDEKKYSLSSFGIMTSADYTEKGLLHIYGDKDDSTYADKTDKLMKAIEEDPDTLAKVMAKITDNLHNALNKKMSKTSLSSALTFYNDKQITNQVTQYKKDISKTESKLEEKEAAYYKQFTAMEKALASLQSQQSALSGLLGIS